MTRVDVVVPSYNYARYLRGCIKSLFDQGGVQVRVLVIDDTSTDDTAAVAAQLLKEYPDLEYRRHQQNKGHIATYNEGLLEWASAPYSMLLSADDLLAPGALGRAIEPMERDRNVGMVCGMALLFESEADIPGAPRAKSNGLPGEPDFQTLPTRDFLLRCVQGNPVSTPSVLLRTELQRAVGGYSAKLPHSGDMEMWMRVAVHAQVGVTRFVQAYKRLHPSNMSKSFYALHDLRQRLEAIEFTCARDPDTYARYGLTRDSVRAGMAEEALWLAYSYFDVGERGAMQDCLRFAQELSPTIPKSLAWRKLQLKSQLGGQLTGTLRSIVGMFQQSRGPQALIDPRQGPRPGTLQGWWPEHLSRSVAQ